MHDMMYDMMMHDVVVIDVVHVMPVTIVMMHRDRRRRGRHGVRLLGRRRRGRRGHHRSRLRRWRTRAGADKRQDAGDGS